MLIPAWQLLTLPPAPIDIRQWSALSKTFHDLDTTVHHDERPSHLRHGQVMWGLNSSSRIAGVAWDWREVQENVVAMCDPMAVQSNIELMDEHGKSLPAGRRLLYLNRLINILPWREHLSSIWQANIELRRAA